ncbi:MAG: radical SAM family heme chaperone HemW [Anaerolineae bacterium]|nr:radical SAM family heme chaperone HemW [Anaerolineae bacterium]
MADKNTILEQLPATQVALYLHIPFCRTRCAYCAFNTYVGLTHLIVPYVQAVLHELRLVAPVPRRTATSIYIGGGTPSFLPAQHIEALLQACRTRFVLPTDAEITLEVNPGAIMAEALAQLRASGVTRLSIGMQSAHDRELTLLGRAHTTADVQATVEHARNAGFDNISLDLICGIPYQTPEHWRSSLDVALALNPEHLSLYSLSIEDATLLQRYIVQGQLPAPDPDRAAEMYEFASDHLAAAGFEQYEISNWTKPGHTCRHNVHVWRNLPYLGFGAGAHGYAAHTRYANTNHPADYIARFNAQQTPLPFPISAAANDVIHLDQQDVVSETLIMGLRLVQEGITGEAYKARFGHDLFTRYGPQIKQLCAHGLLEHDPAAQRVRLTPRGRLLANRVFAEFI